MAIGKPAETAMEISSDFDCLGDKRVGVKAQGLPRWGLDKGKSQTVINPPPHPHSHQNVEKIVLIMGR